MDNKLKNNEIIKAFKRITEYQGFTSSVSKTLKSTLDLINSQNAEIDRLNIELQSMRSAANSYKMHYETAKTEAYKEFAERLKTEIINDTAYACDNTQHSGYYDYQIKIGDIPEYIDNLLKEMMGESDDS